MDGGVFLRLNAMDFIIGWKGGKCFFSFSGASDIDVVLDSDSETIQWQLGVWCEVETEGNGYGVVWVCIGCCYAYTSDTAMGC